MKSVEQKLFEAFQNHRGVNLTEAEVTTLILADDAIRTRISNVASKEAGLGELEGDCINMGCKTWEEFKKHLRDLASPC